MGSHISELYWETVIFTFVFYLGKGGLAVYKHTHTRIYIIQIECVCCYICINSFLGVLFFYANANHEIDYTYLSFKLDKTV